MQTIKPIHVASSGLIPDLSEVNSSNQYIAYTTKTGLFNLDRSIQILDINAKRYFDEDGKRNYDITRRDKVYYFCSIKCSKIKIHDITFNDEGNKLYCLVEKKHTAKLYKFALGNNNSSHMSKPKKVLSPFVAERYTLCRIKGGVLLAGFTNNTIYSAKITKNTNDFKFNYMASFNCEIQINDINFDKNNSNLGVLLNNNKLHILTISDNKWNITSTYDDCKGLPIFSNDGKTLIFSDKKSMQIKSSCFSINKTYEFKNANKIKGICINSTDDKIAIFYDTNYSTYYSVLTKQDNQWSIVSESEFQIFVTLFPNMRSTYKNIVVGFKNDDALITLYNYCDVMPIGSRYHDELITQEEQKKKLEEIKKKESTTKNNCSSRRSKSSRRSRTNNYISFTQTAATGASSSMCSM
jgi:ribosomal protein L24E